MSTRIVLITGTDTGVGKTLLTCLLLCHLRASGARALALKPFCSGGRADAELLHRLQDSELTLDEINPFYFPEPVAPVISARKHKRRVARQAVIDHVLSMAARISETAPSFARHARPNQFLLIEGSGGLLVPLGEDYTVRDLIRQLRCQVLIVARNQLGTINHTLLTLAALGVPTHASSNNSAHSPVVRRVLPGRAIEGQSWPKVVLMDQRLADVSSRTNAAILSEWIRPARLVQIPYLGRHGTSVPAVTNSAKTLKKILAQLVS